jgi:hypothetical protein
MPKQRADRRIAVGDGETAAFRDLREAGLQRPIFAHQRTPLQRGARVFSRPQACAYSGAAAGGDAGLGAG